MSSPPHILSLKFSRWRSSLARCTEGAPPGRLAMHGTALAGLFASGAGREKGEAGGGATGEARVVRDAGRGSAWHVPGTNAREIGSCPQFLRHRLRRELFPAATRLG